MKQFNKITIIGVGLIGGSIGLAIKKKRLAKEVVGVFRRASTLRRAMKCGAVDKGAMSVKDGVKGADLIILATPVLSIPLMAREVIKYAKKGALITDVGSTKEWLVEKIEKIPVAAKSIFFVGSHPMAGSDRTGVEFSRGDLIKGSPCIVTRTTRTDKKSLGKIINFWKALGAKVKVMTPAAHDKSISLVSHLPHLVAFSLAGTVPEKDLIYAAEGFRDTTRVASSDPDLWTEIFLSNKKQVIKSSRRFERYFRKLVKILEKGGYRDISRALESARNKRGKLKYGA